MAELLTHLATLALGFFAMTGPVLVLMMALKARDHQQDRLYARVLSVLNEPDLRGLCTIRVACRPFGRDAVQIDLWGCPPQRIWEVMLRVSESLPPRVKLEVAGITASRAVSSWSLTVSKRFPALPGCTACP
jgi:hypothetical protein